MTVRSAPPPPLPVPVSGDTKSIPWNLGVTAIGMDDGLDH